MLYLMLAMFLYAFQSILIERHLSQISPIMLNVYLHFSCFGFALVSKTLYEGFGIILAFFALLLIAKG